jgi:hypothetical protein
MKANKAVLADYVADKLIEDIRAGVPLGDDLSAAIDQREIIAALRSRVQADDIGWVVTMLKSDRPWQRHIVLHLVRPVVNADVVREQLIALWNKETNWFVMEPLLFALACIDRLDEAHHRRMLALIRTNLDRFITSMTEWWGGAGSSARRTSSENAESGVDTGTLLDLLDMCPWCKQQN